MTTQLINGITLLRNLKIKHLKRKNILLPTLHGAPHVKEKREIFRMRDLRGPNLRNHFFETFKKKLGNKRVVFLKSVKMCLVVATLFYMRNI